MIIWKLNGVIWSLLWGERAKDSNFLHEGEAKKTQKEKFWNLRSFRSMVRKITTEFLVSNPVWKVYIYILCNISGMQFECLTIIFFKSGARKLNTFQSGGQPVKISPLLSLLPSMVSPVNGAYIKRKISLLFMKENPECDVGRWLTAPTGLVWLARNPGIRIIY